MSYFNSYKRAPPDPIFGLNSLIKKDPRAEKIDLLIGYYKDNTGRTPIFKAVIEAEKQLLALGGDFSYLPIDGHPSFITHLKKLIFPVMYHKNLYGAQTVGGTGALYHAAKLLAQKKNCSISLPDQTWANHCQIVNSLNMKIDIYPYYDLILHTLKAEAFFDHLDKLPKGSILLLHGCCHNPSGLGFSHSQWRQIALICRQKELFPFIDCAYQGFGDGLEEDVAGIALMCEHVEELFVAYSCSKNFGLYGERVGALFYFSRSELLQETLCSLIKQNIRANYSNPPCQGALIVNQILTQDTLKTSWQQELISYQKRICTNRALLRQALEEKTGQDFSYVTEGKGLFIFTGLRQESVQLLQEQRAIYLASDGRMNITGLNELNFEPVVKALAEYL